MLENIYILIYNYDGDYIMRANIKSISVEDNQEILLKELKELLGTQSYEKTIDSRDDFEFVLPLVTDFGTINVRIQYRKKYNDLFFLSPDFSTSGTSLRIDLNDRGFISGLCSIDDASIFMPLFKKSKNLFSILQKIVDYDQNKITDRLNKVFLKLLLKEELYKQLRDISKYKYIDVLDLNNKQNNQFVSQGSYRVTTFDINLYTYGLDTCSALCVIDEDKKMQYLAHVDANFQKDKIIESLNNIDYNKSEVFVMYGTSLGEGALLNIHEALKQLKIEDKVIFLGYSGMGYSSVVLQEGIPYSLGNFKEFDNKSKL